MKDRRSGIFMIKNIPNGKIYIGKAEDYRVAKSHYLNKLRKGTFANKHLQEDFNAFNEDEFEFQILEFCHPEELEEKRRFYIKFYRAHMKDAGYNQSNMGQLQDCPTRLLYRRDKDYIDNLQEERRAKKRRSSRLSRYSGKSIVKKAHKVSF